MKVVIVGSFKDVNLFLTARKVFQERGCEVFPDEAFLNGSEPIIKAHHYENTDLPEELLVELGKRENRYLSEIKSADTIYVLNVKDGKEHIGVATAMEIGYAIALGKKIEFHMVPSDQHFKIISRGLVK